MPVMFHSMTVGSSGYVACNAAREERCVTSMLARIHQDPKEREGTKAGPGDFPGGADPSGKRMEREQAAYSEEKEDTGAKIGCEHHDEDVAVLRPTKDKSRFWFRAEDLACVSCEGTPDAPCGKKGQCVYCMSSYLSNYYEENGCNPRTDLSEFLYEFLEPGHSLDLSDIPKLLGDIAPILIEQ